jgi:signal transduction histidine kinase
MLLLGVLSMSILSVYAEHTARSEAQVHLARIKQAYQEHTTELTQTLDVLREDPNIVMLATQQPTPTSTSQLQTLLVSAAIRNHLSSLAIASRNHQFVTRLAAGSTTGEASTSQMMAQDTIQLVDQALRGQTVTLLHTEADQATTSAPWVLSIALALHDGQARPGHVLLASQPIDDYFAQILAQRANANVALCLGGHVQGEAGPITRSDDKVCASTSTNLLAGSQRAITLVDQTKISSQIATSPAMVIAVIEPLTSLPIQNPRLLVMILGIGLFVFALGTILYMVITRNLLILPLRGLQLRIQSLLNVRAGVQVTAPRADEIQVLSQWFTLLAESLENESQAIVEQLKNLLIVSDALMSTLNLEHLLGEIVSRLSDIMQAKHTTLLLYGREMLSPWAVAQLSEQLPSTHQGADTTTRQRAVTVYADPNGDITLAATTKLAAVPSARKNAPSGKRNAVRASKLAQTKLAQIEEPYSLRSLRIPRPALRDLDMILARMAIQRQKIVYAEDILTIQQARPEAWARMALEYGYRGLMAVPLIVQEREQSTRVAIGAYIVYSDRPRQVTNRDTFLLTTAAMQASMAIQNAILFAEVKEKNAALERANQLKSQFLANVTHELRTPLHSIISYGALILEGFLDGELTAEQEEHIQFMVRRAEDLSHLVDDMLDLSKIEADHIEVKLEPVEPGSCVAEVVNQLKPMANSKGLSLTLDVEEGLPKVIADSHRLRQILINLTSNALKFTEKGGVTIRCKLMRNSDMVKFSVNDTGIGISPAALSYIFEAFRQADGSTTRRFGGTGLGLTIAKKLIELQGGEIAVESTPGQGSTFSLTLPMVSSFKNDL